MREKNQRNILLVTKEALIGEHNLKPLLTVHNESIDFWVISQVHSYDILVINTHPQLHLGTPVIIRISYSSWVITITYRTTHQIFNLPINPLLHMHVCLD